MNLKRKFFGAFAALFLCPLAAMAGARFNDYLVYSPVLAAGGVSNGNGTAYSVQATTVGVVGVSTPTVYTSAANMTYASFQAVMTSDTISAQTFTDGDAATGTLTVVSYAALSTATASGSMTISSDTALVGGCISGGGPSGTGVFNVCNPQQWAVDLVYSSNTACNIAAAIAATNVVVSTCSKSGATGIIYSTAAYAGSIWNSFTINSSTPAALNNATFKGGQDAATISVNGLTLTANKDWYPVTSNNQTATNIATAITNSSATTGVSGSPSSAVVTLTATAVGSQGNYAITTSSNSALTVGVLVSSQTSGPAIGTMVTGTNASYTIGTTAITIPKHGFNTGLALLYGQGSHAISGLTDKTTYYVSYVDANTIALATSTVSALNGTLITLASSQTLTTPDTFTLTPLAISGTPGWQLQVSNDGTNWVNTQSAVSYASYNSTGTVTLFDLGAFDYGWIGVKVTPPTTGAINMQMKLVGKGAS